MRYLGNKSRIAKEILPIILKDRQKNQCYVEPFVGGANTIHLIDGYRIGGDANYHLIKFWKAIQDGWVPPDRITKNQYLDIKNNQDRDSKLTIWAGVCCSYGGKWFGGYLNDYQESKRLKNGRLPNHQDEAKRGLIKQIPNLISTHFVHSDYKNLYIPENSIIYCDPPYVNTLKYQNEIEYSHFWHWCRQQHYIGNQIFISSYEAPKDFVCVWEKEINNTLSRNKKFKAIEKLFTYE